MTQRETIYVSFLSHATGIRKVLNDFPHVERGVLSRSVLTSNRLCGLGLGLIYIVNTKLIRKLIENRDFRQLKCVLFLKIHLILP